MTPEHEHEYGEQRGVTVEVMRVTAVTFARGTGCCERSPYRMVTAYYDQRGALLFERDFAEPVKTPDDIDQWDPRRRGIA